MKLDELLGIMDRLRGEGGCPWDREQTRSSLKPYIIEEAYEVFEAIGEGDPEKIKEELGDLLFQIVFQCRIAEENGEFGMSDVIDSIGRKMINRHPHVFSDKKCRTPEEVVAQWEILKKKEGKLRGSILEGVPEAMSSLLRAERLQKRAAQVGFDWEKTEDVLAKVEEELSEVREALEKGERSEIEEELGDLFFMLVNLSRFTGVNAEDAHRRTIGKFIRRFRYIEMKASETGASLHEMSLSEMDKLWDEAKELE
jgi:tetrapyrrole methylase family protein / MazG family protein